MNELKQHILLLPISSLNKARGTEIHVGNNGISSSSSVSEMPLLVLSSLLSCWGAAGRELEVLGQASPTGKRVKVIHGASGCPAPALAPRAHCAASGQRLGRGFAIHKFLTGFRAKLYTKHEATRRNPGLGSLGVCFVAFIVIKHV